MASETKTAHTPGPWVLLDRNDRGDIWVGPTRETNSALLENGVGIVMIREISGQLEPEEVAANALLIAAAPDLLEALRLAYVAMEHMGDVLNGMDAVTPEDEQRFTPAFEKTRAAIAKATGAQA